MNVGAIYEKLKLVDKQVIMSSLSWDDKYKQIQLNLDYGKLIFISLDALLDLLKKERQWINNANESDPDDFDSDTQRLYNISMDHPHVSKRLIKTVKLKLKEGT